VSKSVIDPVGGSLLRIDEIAIRCPPIESRRELSEWIGLAYISKSCSADSHMGVES